MGYFLTCIQISPFGMPVRQMALGMMCMTFSSWVGKVVAGAQSISISRLGSYPMQPTT